MFWRRLISVLIGIFALGVLPILAAGPGGEVFTIVVAQGTQARDVQVRYVVTDTSGRTWRSAEIAQDGNKLIVKNSAEAAAAHSFRGIAYAPGCQFVTIDASDLTLGNTADFQCQKLPTTQLSGRLAGSDSGNLQIETVYDLEWAHRFFEVPGINFSPFSLGKTAVHSDGSFTVELPDFTADPLWNTLANDAGLMFFLVDGKSGRRLGLLSSTFDTRAGFIKVESSYPREIGFSILEDFGRTPRR